MSRFLSALRSGKVLLMDGAMGTELQRAGLGPGECAEAWNLTQPDVVQDVHRSYVEAGARCLVTNSFQANLDALGKYGLQGKLAEINRRAIELARAAGGPEAFVLGSIGPMEPRGNLSRVVESLAGADALLFETWSDVTALAVAVEARQKILGSKGPPVLVSFALARFPGTGPIPLWANRREVKAAHVARAAKDLGLSAVGLNCGREIGLDDLLRVVEGFRKGADLPVFVRPNAGTPIRLAGRWVYPVSPTVLADWSARLLRAGVAMIGGCCGTTPAHIAALQRAMNDLSRS